MNRLSRLIVLGKLGLVIAASSAHASHPPELKNCLQKASCGLCKLELSNVMAANSSDPGNRRCHKTALSWLPYADGLLNPTSDLFGDVVNVSAQRAALEWPRPEGYDKTTSQTNLIRPRTGGQLYAQRLITLRAGQLYSRITPSTFADQWQTAWQQPTYQQWQSLLAQEAAMMATRQGNSHLTVLVGDSLYLWMPQEHLSEDRLWLNQSISGETTGHVLQRLNYFANVRPNVIYVMTGVNDLKSGVDRRVIASNMELIVQRLKVQHPRSQIVVLSILPTRRPPISGPMIRQVNQQIANAVWQRGVEFVDLEPTFMDGQGLLRVDLTTDGIHLSPQGYSLLATYLNNP